MIKTPKELAQEYANSNSGGECQNDEPGIIAAFIAGYKAAPQQWISVKDRLPNYDELNLLWSITFNQQFVGRRRDSGTEDPLFYWECSQDFFEAWETSTFPRLLNPTEVTYWMPLPQPPKEEK